MTLQDVNLLKLLTEEGISHPYPVGYLLMGLSCRQKTSGPKLFKNNFGKKSTFLWDIQLLK